MKRIVSLLLAILLCLTVLPCNYVFAEPGTLRGYFYLVDFMKANGERESEGLYECSYSWSKVLNEEGTATLSMFFWDEFGDDDLDYISFNLRYRDERNGKDVIAGISFRQAYITMLNGSAGYREVDIHGGTLDSLVHYSADIDPFSLNMNGAGFRNGTYSGPAEEEAQTKQKAYAATFALLDHLNDLVSPAGYDVVRDFNFWNYQGHGENHTYLTSNVTKEPTCLEDGRGTSVCLYCGKERSDVYPAKGHSFSEWKTVREADCEPGSKKRVCSACGCEETEIIPALGHAWALTEVQTEGETLHESTGLYTCARCGETKETPLCACEVFTDMPKKSHWAHDAIDWAYFNQLTGGTSATTFSPNKVVTRGEVVTFLHTIKNKPEAEAANPFTDVKQKDFFYNAVLWAVENGVTKGTTETTFSPKRICTRAEIVMFLWAAAGRPEPESTENKFQDVKEKDYYYHAELWAVENGITGGVDLTHFSPSVSCTRAQTMLFLKAAYPILTAEEPPEEPSEPTEPTDPTEPVDPEE